MAWHILRKDWQLLRWLVLALAALQAVLALARFKLGPMGDIRELALVAGLPGSLMTFLVAAFVIAAVVHQDAIPGFRQDWLVRPIKRVDLLLAKLLFIIVMIQGPMFVTDLAQGIASGFPISQALGAAVARAVFVFGTFSIPVFALAALTRNLTQVVVGLVGILLIVIAFLVIPAALGGWTSPIALTGVSWVPTVARQALVFIAALAVLGMQYLGRRTVPARIVFGAMLVLGQFTQFLPWTGAFGVEKLVSAAPGREDTLSLAFEPGIGRLRTTMGQNVDDVVEKPGMGPVDVAAENQRRRAEGAVTIFVPVRLTGLAAPSLLFADRSEVRLTDASGATIYRGAGNDFDVRRDGQTGESVASHQGVRIPRMIYDRLKGQTVNLEIEYSLTLFRLEAAYGVSALDGDQRMPGVGWCKTRTDVSGTAVQVRCLQAGERPSCFTVALYHPASGQKNPDVSVCAPDYTPFPGHAIPDSMSRFGGNLPFSDRQGLAHYAVDSAKLPESQVLVKLYDPSTHVTRRVAAPAIRLQDWLPETPLP